MTGSEGRNERGDASGSSSRTIPPELIEASDRHGTLSMDALLERGCTCEFGCLRCDEPLARMGNCPGWNACPIGREPDPDCRLSKRRIRMDLGDGAYMDTTIAADTSPETLDALRALGEAAVAHMEASRV